jgi:hypothetical protein
MAQQQLPGLPRRLGEVSLLQRIQGGFMSRGV